jgi:NAD(P)-dependent dehydrogenase (short-subunit alcohol dehydrogenase family)
MSCWLWFFGGVAVLVLAIRWLYSTPTGPAQATRGSIFVTGCDSGMGLVSAERLAAKGFRVFFGCYLRESVARVDALRDSRCVGVQIDVTNDASVAAAVAHVEAQLRASAGSDAALVGIVNCAGVAFEGPAEYFPMALFQRQLDVNLLGYVRTTQAFFPLLKRGVAAAGRRGRVVLVGTGGGVPAAMPATIGAYMASKWGVEAWMQALRQELNLRGVPIDVTVINPGTIKPTGLMDNGKANLERAWTLMPGAARDEYGDMLDAFVRWGEAEKGTPPSAIADAMERAMTDYRTPLRYKVGPDSQAAPFAGLAPTWLREFAIRKTVFASYKPKPYVPKTD